MSSKTVGIRTGHSCEYVFVCVFCVCVCATPVPKDVGLTVSAVMSAGGQRAFLDRAA